MGVPKRLTEMQKRFAEYIVFNEGKTTGMEAAIAAGYSKDRDAISISYSGKRTKVGVTSVRGGWIVSNKNFTQENFCDDWRKVESEYSF